MTGAVRSRLPGHALWESLGQVVRTHRHTPVALAVVCSALGFLLVVTASSVTAAKRAEAPRRARLVALIQDRRNQVSVLDQAVRELRARVGKAQDQATRTAAGDKALAARLARLALLAGTTAVHGQGLEVRLADSTRAGSSTDDAGAFRIHDRDLQLVVNALFAAGAEAVSVNDVRLVATSPIRSAGATIVVSFRPLNPPYVVKAIGARLGEFDDSEVARLFDRWREVFGLGFRVREVDDLVVAAYTGRVAVAAATPG